MIPLLDLQKQYAAIGDEIEAAVTRVLRSGRYALGPEVEAFEGEFSDLCGARHGIGVNSGTSALYVALRVCDVGPGDEVITVPFTFVATVAAIRQTGARVRFVDVDPWSLTMDPRALEDQITERTKAIVPVHLFGQPAPMGAILEIARRRRVLVIEDAAQAHGAAYEGRPVGGLGDLGCFSFYPSKNLGACGEGGMIVTSNDEWARVARSLRDWGQERQYHHVLNGGNYRLDAIQAAVLRVKLGHLATWTKARQRVAQRYDAAFADSPVDTPDVRQNVEHVYHVYAIRCRRRDALRDALATRDIQTAIHYRAPVHLQPAYADLGFAPGSFPSAERAAEELLSLPIYPELTEVSQDQVIAAVRDFYS